MAATDPVTPDPRRFSIRLPRALWIGLAAVVLIVVAIALRICVPIYRQQVAIREIERLSGTANSQKRGPECLRRWLGDERLSLFDTVIAVNLRNTKATDATLKQVGSLTEVHDLWLDRTQLSNAGLVHATRLTRLKRLSLDGTNVTDTGLAKLKGLTSLEYLSVANSQVTDAGLAHLKRLPRLEWLVLDGTRVTDAGLVSLKGLSKLDVLWVYNTQVTDAGITEMKRALPGLRMYRE